MAKGSLVASVPAARPREPKSSRCSVLEMTPAAPRRPRSVCSRSASQAPPDQMPTSTLSGLSRPRTPPSSSAYSASASSCSMAFIEAGAGTGRGSPPPRPRRHRPRRRPALRWCCSARRPRAPAGRKRPCSWRPKRRARRVLSCAAPSGWKGTPTTSAAGCHSCTSASMAAKRASPCRGHRLQRLRLAQQRVAHCHADAAGAEVESQETTDRGTRRALARQRPAHACPASCDSMRGSKPSSDSARS